jgi:hypothetical protein
VRPPNTIGVFGTRYHLIAVLQTNELKAALLRVIFRGKFIRQTVQGIRINAEYLHQLGRIDRLTRCK